MLAQAGQHPRYVVVAVLLVAVLFVAAVLPEAVPELVPVLAL